LPTVANDCDGSRLIERKLPGQDSNLDKESQNVFAPGHKSIRNQTLGRNEEQLSALLAHLALTDPDLSRLCSAWPALPDHIRAAILALVAAGR
jgi:hypothetical protein